MPAKKTIKNQITLPKKIAEQFPRVVYFDVRTEDNSIILEPLATDRNAQVRAKLKRLKFTAADITKAVAWARKTTNKRSHARPRLPKISLGTG